MHGGLSAALSLFGGVLVLALNGRKVSAWGGALLYKLGKLRYPTMSHNLKHNHNTQQPTQAAAAPPPSSFAL